MDEPAKKLWSVFGSKFETIKTATTFATYLQPLLDLVPAIRDVTVAADYFLPSKGQAPRVGEVTGATNQVQYRLLCLILPSKPKSSTLQKSDSLLQPTQLIRSPSRTLEILRLAALIYSDLVISP